MNAIVCYPMRKACWCCDSSVPEKGGWIVAEKYRTYCSLDCHDAWEEFLRDEAAKRACCPECGFDQQEHNETCSKARAAS